MKIPQLIAYLKKYVTTDVDAAISLVDPTGEIEGSFHKQVTLSYPDLCVGSVLILRGVAVFCTPTSHFLNITLENIVKIFPPDISYPLQYRPVRNDNPSMEFIIFL